MQKQAVRDLQVTLDWVFDSDVSHVFCGEENGITVTVT